jgi:hypothetical protein
MKTTLPCLLALIAPLSAGELTPSQVPAAAKWVLHADLEAMRSSETGKTVFEFIESEHGPKLRAIKRMFSFHPVNDLRDITLLGDGKQDHAVILLDGTFDRAHIEDVLKAADDYSESSHAGFTIHSWKDKGKPQHAAFAAQDLIVFSLQDHLLRHELDVLQGKAPAAEVAVFPSGGSKPLIAMAAKLADIEMPADTASVLRNANLMTISAHEDGGRFSIRMGAETTDATRANRLRRILDGVVALAETRVEALTSEGFQSDITATNQPGVAAAVSLPVPEWLTLMKNLAAMQK